jgi:5-methylthioadenosine/S-adenosylhomocysteine deaminase
MTARAVTAARTVYTARWVLPIAAAPIVDGAVVVEGARIAYVGPARTLPAQHEAVRIVALGDAVLLPGLVNVHTHLELTAMRGFLEGLAFRDWLRALTRARADCFEPESLYDSACAGIEEALRNGITTCADTTESGETLAAMRDLGVRGLGYLEVFGPDPAQRDASMSGLMARANALRARDTDLVRTGLSPHAPYTVSDALFRAVAEQSRQEQWPLAVHVAESHAETAFVRDASGPFADALRARGIVVSHKARSPIAWLDDCGILSCRPLLIHAIQVDGEDIGRIADTGAAIAHCPISNLKLGHGVAPLDAFLTAGIPTGLGTDSVASNDRMDLLGEARQAALLQAMRRGLPDALGAHDALSLATLGGAAALGLADRIGSLEIGKDADLAAFSLNAADARPVHDPAVTLVHVLAGSQPAMLVVVAGRELVRDGALIDADATRQGRIELLGDRLRAWRTRFLAT